MPTSARVLPMSPHAPTAPSDPDLFYQELTARNFHFIPQQWQSKLRKLKVLVAGCGSVGGACTIPLARLGVTHFRLADNGDYELTNLNRQHCTSEHIGWNKAKFHETQIRALNPHADVQSFTDGITPTNIKELVQWADVIFDGVDVTTPDGMNSKLSLHEHAHAAKKPTFMSLDMGFCQWGQSFDYRKLSAPLRGNIAAARAATHPIKALFLFCPPRFIPTHTLPLVIELLEGGTMPASQLACAADQLSALFSAAVIRYVSTGDVVRGWNADVAAIALPWRARARLALKRPFLRLKLWRLMRKIR